MGRATAECFARDGARVAILGRTQADLDETVEHLAAIGSPDALGIKTDITRPEQVEQAFAQLGERWGALNILVNSAGPNVSGGFETLSDEEWIASIDMGAMGMVRCVRAALPLLRRAEWARIVNISAHSTKRQTASLVSYTAAKAMVTSISKNLSLSLAPEEILVNTVSPGSFATPALPPPGARPPSATCAVLPPKPARAPDTPNQVTDPGPPVGSGAERKTGKPPRPAGRPAPVRRVGSGPGGSRKSRRAGRSAS